MFYLRKYIDKESLFVPERRRISRMFADLHGNNPVQDVDKVYLLLWPTVASDWSSFFLVISAYPQDTLFI